jgi:hypothetical protein
LDFKNQGKKSAKTRKLGFLRNNCAQGGGDSRRPTKNQGENQGSRKPSVLVGFLRQKKGLCIPSPQSKEQLMPLPHLWNSVWRKRSRLEHIQTVKQEIGFNFV